MARSAWGAIGKALVTGIKNTIAANTKKNNTSSSSSSSSNRGSSSSSGGGSSGGSSYGHSSGGSSDDWLKQAHANSNAWHTADAATRKKLKEENRHLYTAHGYTYNGKTGTWSAPLSAEQQQ